MNAVVELGLSRCGRGKVWRQAYRTRAGQVVSGTCVTDRGRPGKGPKTLPQPRAGSLRGWKKTMPAGTRRKVVGRIAREEGCGTALKRLNLLANFTKKTSPETHRKARADMKWLRNSAPCKVRK